MTIEFKPKVGIGLHACLNGEDEGEFFTDAISIDADLQEDIEIKVRMNTGDVKGSEMLITLSENEAIAFAELLSTVARYHVMQ